MRNSIKGGLSVGVLGVLVTACAANTGSTENAGSTTEADTTGCQNNSAQVDNTYSASAGCYGNEISASSYSSDACNAYTAEWDYTDQDPTQLFRVDLFPNVDLNTEALCQTTTISATVYGLEVTVNEASHTDTVDWIPITSASPVGKWMGDYCAFNGSQLFSLSFSGLVPSPSPTTVRDYESIKVVAQVTQPIDIIVKGKAPEKTPEGIPIEPRFGYEPFSLLLQEQSCAQ